MQGEESLYSIEVIRGILLQGEEFLYFIFRDVKQNYGVQELVLYFVQCES